HPALNELRIELVAPDGVTTVPLVRNGTSATGAATGQGITGANLGTSTSGIPLGTVFDQEAPRAIVGGGGAAPFTGHLRPETSLTPFYGMQAGQVNGNWTLRITDFRSGNTGTLVNWTMTFTSGLRPSTDTVVTTTTVRGALTSPY